MQQLLRHNLCNVLNVLDLRISRPPCHNLYFRGLICATCEVCKQLEVVMICNALCRFAGHNVTVYDGGGDDNGWCACATTMPTSRQLCRCEIQAGRYSSGQIRCVSAQACVRISNCIDINSSIGLPITWRCGGPYFTKCWQVTIHEHAHVSLTLVRMGCLSFEHTENRASPCHSYIMRNFRFDH